MWHLFMPICYYFVLWVLVVLAKKFSRLTLGLGKMSICQQSNCGASDQLVILCAVLTVLRSLEN